MRIIVHRGTHQIGGCATEIRTETSRIIIDCGSELEGNTPLNINGVTDGKSDCNAVIFTHYHGDHIGLLDNINEDIPVYIGELSLDILMLQNKRQRLYSDSTVNRIRKYQTAKTMRFGDISVTPYMVDHSAFDSHMFLIEADGKKVLHTGDFRTHGFRGKGLIPTLVRYIGTVDALICEGTTIGRNSSAVMTEMDLLNKARELMNENKYVFVACASTNIDRIAAFCASVPRGKYCVCDSYQKALVDIVKSKSEKYSSLYSFRKLLEYGNNLDVKMEQSGFCTFIRPGNHFSDVLLTKYKSKNPLIIYSMWSGYLEQNTSLQELFKDFNVVHLHTSGHADIASITKLVEIVKPSLIIPIHTNQPERFPDILNNLIKANDGEAIIL